MATAFSRADAVGLYLTGAYNDNAAGTVAASLGGARMPVEVKACEALISGGLPAVIVEHVAGVPGEGAARIRATGASALAFTPVNGTEGAPVAIADGGIVLLEGASGDQYVRVRRDGADNFGTDAFELEVRAPFDGLIGMGDVDATHSASGDNEYLSGILNAHGEEAVTMVVYLGTLGTQRVSNSAHLGASGSGTIATATTNGFADAPHTGWARVTKADTTLREIVYYSSRTSTVLTVPSAGRARLGTSAAAGAADDVIDFVPGIRIALEAPDADGAIQTIATRRTAPTGLTWSTAISSGAALTTGAVNPLDNYGLWIHREIPVGAKASLEHQNVIFMENGGFHKKYRGRYRIAESAAAVFNVFIGEDARPDFTTAPAQVETAVPFTIALTPPVSGTKTYQYTVRRTDQYGVSSYNTYAHSKTIDDTGADLDGDVSAPYSVTVEEIGGGYIRIQARYPTGVDDLGDADFFNLYSSFDGTDPVVDGNTGDVAMSIGQGLDSSRVLNFTTGPLAYGTDVKIVVTAYRSDDGHESTNTTPVELTIALVAPPTPAGVGSGTDGANQYDHGAMFAPSNTVLSSGWYWRTMPGATELWSASGLVLRGLAGGNNQNTLNFPSDYGILPGSVSGAGVAGPIQIASATVAYLCVDGQRVAKLDTTAKTITAADFSAIGSMSPDAPIIGAAQCAPGHTYLQVYDAALGRWRSFVSVDAAGLFSARWMQNRKS